MESSKSFLLFFIPTYFHFPKYKTKDFNDLCDKLVWNWSKVNWSWWVDNHAGQHWLLWLALEDDAHALQSSFLAFNVVLLNALKVILTTSGWLDVLNAHVNALGEDLSTMTLVHDNSQSVFRDIVDAASLSVISFERHTLVNCTMALKMRNTTR